MEETSETRMNDDLPFSAEAEQDLPAAHEPSEKVAELLDAIDAADISLDELLDLTLCNIAELASIYGDAADETDHSDEVAYTTAALTRLQIATGVLAELLPGDDDGDDELEEGEELEDAA